MRQIATAARIRKFLTHLGRAVDHPVTAYLAGGSTAVLMGWRDSTIDIDLKLVPESSTVMRAISTLKDEHQVNVELASPDLFIPVPPGWEDRSPAVMVAGALSVRHFDLTAQAMAKLERGHARDRADVAAMLEPVRRSRPSAALNSLPGRLMPASRHPGRPPAAAWAAGGASQRSRQFGLAPWVAVTGR